MSLTVREARKQQLHQERLLRIQSARKHGMALGVAAARNYQTDKLDQRNAVAADLRKNWELERAAIAGQRGALVTYAQQEAGEAHKAADRVMAERTARAAAESLAWDAEHRLHKMRAAVSHKTEQAERELKEAYQREVNAHRARTRAEEISRSQQLVQAKKRQSERVAMMGLDIPLVPRSAAETAQDATRPKVHVYHRDGAKAAVTFAVPPELSSDTDYEPPGDVAEKKKVENSERKRIAAAKTRQAQERAQHNAALKAAVEREEQDRRNREKQNIKYVMEAASKQQNLASATARGVTGANARDFQAEESRRSEMLNRKAHQEFEYTFLQIQKEQQEAAAAAAAAGGSVASGGSRQSSEQQQQQQQPQYRHTAAAATADALARRRQLRDATFFFDPEQDAAIGASAEGEGDWWSKKPEHDYSSENNNTKSASRAGGGGVILGGRKPMLASGGGGGTVARQLVTDTIATNVLPDRSGVVAASSSSGVGSN